jgi:hypothetical protein
MHPRALLTPFTDNVALTKGDKRAYTGQAKAQRSKGFEHIEVGFTPPPAEPEPEPVESPVESEPEPAGDPGDGSDGAAESRHA